MGSEAICTAHLGKKRSSGKARLETNEILFHPVDGSPRLKIPISTIKSAKTLDGELRLRTSDGPIAFELGPVAEKWCHKILHPKTRAEKLGLKAGMKVATLGAFDPDFLQELRATTKKIHEGKMAANSDLLFLRVSSTKNLASGVNRTAKAIKGATALWVVYPKGKKEITENDVLSIGRKAGLKDVKVVGFSATHTALKFVLPLSSR